MSPDARPPQPTPGEIPWPRAGRFVAWAVARSLLAQVRRLGPRLPAEGPLIVALRHIHELDGFAVPLALDERPLFGVVDGRIAGIRTAALPLVPWISRRIGVIPVDRDDPRDRLRALRELRLHLAAGAAVAIAPEGDVVHERRRAGRTLADYYRAIGPGRAILEWVRPPLHTEAKGGPFFQGAIQDGTLALARWTAAPIAPVGVAYLRRRGGGRPVAFVLTGPLLPPDTPAPDLLSTLLRLSSEAFRAGRSRT